MKLIAHSEADMPRIGRAIRDMGWPEAEAWVVPKSAPWFEVSAAGRVRSLSRDVPCRNGVRTIAGRERRLVEARATGYLKVGIGRKGEWLVHRLVAEAFCNCPQGASQVNHKNGDRRDNRAENLEWVTAAQNIQHAYRSLKRNGSAKGKFSGRHPASKAVIARDIRTGTERAFDCALDAVRALGADSGGISRCCAGRIKSHRGYEWRFAP